jgi:hypothetical protein
MDTIRSFSELTRTPPQIQSGGSVSFLVLTLPGINDDKL